MQCDPNQHKPLHVNDDSETLSKPIVPYKANDLCPPIGTFHQQSVLVGHLWYQSLQKEGPGVTEWTERA